jgi:acyl carrier protein
MEELNQSGATFMQATPATWRMLCEAGWQGDPRLVALCGGEALPADLAALLQSRTKALWNMYGPTETTIWSTHKRLQGPDISIGAPIANTQVYIIQSPGQLAPVGVPGQLLIGGLGLARGYLNRPDLTAEAFSPDPFGQPGARLYQTGDLARLRPDGSLEYLGRIDHQVKIRGFRIELGEIEAVLGAAQNVRQAVVVAHGQGAQSRLVAYLTIEQSPAPTPAQLRAAIKEHLPDYMLPSAFIILEAMPATPNGKIDRKALPAPETVSLGPVQLVAPRDSIEIQLAALWEKAFRKSPISIHADFFELGGHSMLAVRLFQQIEKMTGKLLPLATLFQAPTIAQLAELLRQTGYQPVWRSLVPIKASGSRPPFYCVHGVGGNILEYMDLAKYMHPDQPFYGVQARGLDGNKAAQEGVEVIAGYYIDEIRELQPKGPYLRTDLQVPQPAPQG